MTTRWPWISVLISLATLSPLGRDVVDSAFLAGEALSRNIWAPIALTIIAVMTVAILLEWLVRTYILNRRARGVTS